MIVVLKSIGGELLELELEASSPVAHLKVKASEYWQVPAQCVKLVIGERALSDTEICASLCKDQNMKLYVSMLISMDVLCQALTDERVNRSTKLETLKLLCSLGRKGKMAIDAVMTLLEHQSAIVRLAALEALQKIGRDDVHAIECASELLVHKMEEVRQTGIRALAMLADRGDLRVVQAATSHLQQPRSPPVKAAALQALSMVAQHGDEDTIALVSAVMLDEDPAVRFRAVQAMSKLARRADERAIFSVLQCFGDEDWHVRLAAVSAMSLLAEPNQRILTLVRGMLQDDEEMVRSEAATFLSTVVIGYSEKDMDFSEAPAF